MYVVVRLEVNLRAEVRHADRQVRVRIEVEHLGTTSPTTRETVLALSGEVAGRMRASSRSAGMSATASRRRSAKTSGPGLPMP